MIVVASWALYHFLAPASWREWTGAGLPLRPCSNLRGPIPAPRDDV